MGRQKKYFSVDVEASGNTPGKYSMLSLGACLVDDLNNTFYRELKPISNNFNEDAMRIGCLGLHCLEPWKYLKVFNPEHHNFDPRRALEVLMDEGEEPEKVMKEYYETPKGRAQDNPRVKTPPRPRMPQPATPKAQAAPKVVRPVEKAKPKATSKSGIDAALDGIE